MLKPGVYSLANPVGGARYFRCRQCHRLTYASQNSRYVLLEAFFGTLRIMRVYPATADDKARAVVGGRARERHRRITTARFSLVAQVKTMAGRRQIASGGAFETPR
jgi:hypothetical protein